MKNRCNGQDLVCQVFEQPLWPIPYVPLVRVPVQVSQPFSLQALQPATSSLTQ